MGGSGVLFEEVVSDIGLGYWFVLRGQVDCMFFYVCAVVLLVISVVGLVGVFTVACVVSVIVVAVLGRGMCLVCSCMVLGLCHQGGWLWRKFPC